MRSPTLLFMGALPGSLSNPGPGSRNGTYGGNSRHAGCRDGCGRCRGGKAPTVKAIDWPADPPVNNEVCLSAVAVAYVCPLPPVNKPMPPSTRRRTCGGAGDSAAPLLLWGFDN